MVVFWCVLFYLYCMCKLKFRKGGTQNEGKKEVHKRSRTGYGGVLSPFGVRSLGSHKTLSTSQLWSSGCNSSLVMESLSDQRASSRFIRPQACAPLPGSKGQLIINTDH